jgi:hypothetical protein
MANALERNRADPSTHEDDTRKSEEEEPYEREYNACREKSGLIEKRVRPANPDPSLLLVVEG